MKGTSSGSPSCTTLSPPPFTISIFSLRKFQLSPLPSLLLFGIIYPSPLLPPCSSCKLWILCGGVCSRSSWWGYLTPWLIRALKEHRRPGLGGSWLWSMCAVDSFCSMLNICKAGGWVGWEALWIWKVKKVSLRWGQPESGAKMDIVHDYMAWNGCRKHALVPFLLLWEAASTLWQFVGCILANKPPLFSLHLGSATEVLDNKGWDAKRKEWSKPSFCHDTINFDFLRKHILNTWTIFNTVFFLVLVLGTKQLEAFLFATCFIQHNWRECPQRFSYVHVSTPRMSNCGWLRAFANICRLSGRKEMERARSIYCKDYACRPQW